MKVPDAVIGNSTDFYKQSDIGQKANAEIPEVAVGERNQDVTITQLHGEVSAGVIQWESHVTGSSGSCSLGYIVNQLIMADTLLSFALQVLCYIYAIAV